MFNYMNIVLKTLKFVLHYRSVLSIKMYSIDVKITNELFRA